MALRRNDVRSKIRAKWAGALLLALLLPVLSCNGCKPSNSGNGTAANNPTSTPSNTGNQGDQIVVGEYGSITGSEASFGQSTDQGIKLAMEAVNGAGGVNGKQIRIELEDDQSDATKAETAVKRLIDEKHVIAVLGEVASGSSLAGGRVCQDNHIPMISPSSTKTNVTEIGDDIFRVCFIDPFQAAVMARFAHDGLKVTNVAIFTNKTAPYSIGFSDDFEKAFTRMGGKIVAKQAYSKDDKDYRGALTAIKAANPQAILVPGYYSDAGAIAKQARDLGITVPLLGGDGWDSQTLFQTGGDAVNGCYFSDHVAVDDPNPTVQNFVKTYEAKYGKKPDALAALAYDAANLMFDAMKRAKSLSSADIRDAIAATKDFPGVTGKITIDSKRNASKPAVIIAIKDKQFKYQTTIADPDQPLTTQTGSTAPTPQG